MCFCINRACVYVAARSSVDVQPIITVRSPVPIRVILMWGSTAIVKGACMRICVERGLCLKFGMRICNSHTTDYAVLLREWYATSILIDSVIRTLFANQLIPRHCSLNTDHPCTCIYSCAGGVPLDPARRNSALKHESVVMIAASPAAAARVIPVHPDASAGRGGGSSSRGRGRRGGSGPRRSSPRSAALTMEMIDAGLAEAFRRLGGSPP